MRRLITLVVVAVVAVSCAPDRQRRTGKGRAHGRSTPNGSRAAKDIDKFVVVLRRDGYHD